MTAEIILHVMRQRAELLTHVQHTTSPYNLPESGQKSAYTAHRHGLTERFANPAAQQRVEVDLALRGHYAEWRRDIALSVRKAAKPQDANARSLLRTGPGIGESLSLVRR
jgi:hypothetical protein